jgi:hypothetical protein
MSLKKKLHCVSENAENTRPQNQNTLNKILYLQLLFKP